MGWHQISGEWYHKTPVVLIKGIQEVNYVVPPYIIILFNQDEIWDKNLLAKLADNKIGEIVYG